MRNILTRAKLAATALTPALVLLSGPTACTGSPATLASQPDFGVLTQAGVASVSIRRSPPGITDAQFAEWVRAGMERAAPGSVIAGPVERPFPAQRIVWHVNPAAPPRGASRLVVNVFNGSTPYAYEQEVVADSEPRAVISSALESMSERLLADVAAQANAPIQPAAQAQPAETNHTTFSRR